MSEFDLPVPGRAAPTADARAAEPGLPDIAADVDGERTILILDTRANIRFCSRPRLFGYSGDELCERPIRFLVPSLALRESTPGYNVAYARFWANHGLWQRHPVCIRGGSDIPVDIRLEPLVFDRRHCLIAELRAPRQAPVRARSLDHLLQAAEARSEAIMVTDTGGVIEYANAAFERISGYRREEALGATPRILASGAHGPDFYREMWSSLAAGREFRAVFVNCRRNGSVYHEEKVIRPFVDPAGRTTHFVSIGRDVTTRADGLFGVGRDATTGLPDRTLFEDRLRQAIARNARRDSGFCLLRVAVDGLGESAAHEAAPLLRSLGLALRGRVRGEDTVARFDGHGFGLILEESGSSGAAGQLGRRIIATLEQALPADAGRFGISVRIGACLFPEDGDDAATLIRHAEAALHEAQAPRGNGFAFFHGPAAALPARRMDMALPARGEAPRTWFG